MCGLVGVYGLIGDKEKAVFQDLLDLDIMRGHHSTGVAFIPQDEQSPPITVKDVVFPYELMRREDFNEAMNGSNIALIGHNRAATRGEVIYENAHPFTHGDITLAHNGTLTGKHRLPDANKFNTDSEALCHAVNVDGIEKTYEKLEGAAALSWWDDEHYTINLITNGERPLHITVVNEGKTIIWSSSNDILKTCVHRRDLTPVKGSFFKLLDHNLSSFFVDENGLVKEVSTKLVPFQKPIHSRISYSNGYKGTPYDQGYQTIWSNKGKKEEEKEKEVAYASNYEVPKLGGRIISKDRFMELFDKISCIFCGESVRDEYGTCTVIDEATAACEDCTGTAKDFGIQVA